MSNHPAVPNRVKQSLTLDLEIVTPMFIGGSDQQAVDIRPPAVKGALRFWWRALNWPRLRAEAGQDKKALQALHAEEEKLFGSAFGNAGRQALFTLRVEKQEVRRETLSRVSGGQIYLLGQGLYRGSAKRDCLLPGGRFRVSLVSKPGKAGPNAEQWGQLRRAGLIFGLIGTLGARARKGFGSVAVRGCSDPDWIAPETVEDYRAALIELIPDCGSGAPELPPFSAFSAWSRVDVSTIGPSADEELTRIGREQQLYRGFGLNGKVDGRDAEKNFHNDHDDMLAVAEGGRPTRLPRRAVFGLPHNYFYSSLKSGVEIKPSLKGERRASPLFSHVHGFVNGTAVTLQLLLPAQFLPEESQSVQFRPQRGKSHSYRLTDGDIDWQVLHDYLNRYQEKICVLRPSRGERS